jgi:hypothetical protein
MVSKVSSTLGFSSASMAASDLALVVLRRWKKGGPLGGSLFHFRESVLRLSALFRAAPGTA